MSDQVGEAMLADPLEGLHTIKVHWDPEKQDVALVEFDTGEFKTFPFVLAVLEMAKDKLKQLWAHSTQQQQIQQLMQSQQDQMLQEQIKKSLRRS